MKNFLKLFLPLVIVCIYACQGPKSYVITGNLTGFTDSSWVYLRNLSTEELFDSTLLIDNKFKLKGQLQEEPEQIWLIIKTGNKSVYTNLLIGNEKIYIKGDIRDFPWNVKTSGSKTQDEYINLLSLTKSLEIKRDSILQSYFNLSLIEQEEKGKATWATIRIIDDSMQVRRIKYVKTHINTFPALITLGYLKNSLPKDSLRALYNSLPDNIKASKYANIIKVYINEKISEIGDSIHNFKALNQLEDTISFSSLVGKYILLDFTTAYCGPCIQSAEELRMINRLYSDSLKIVSFSGDSKKEFWLNSLKRDSVSWVSLWDGKGSYSETSIKYGVQGFPTFFLINPKGKIIDKWVGYGKGSLENKLGRFKNK